MSDLYADRLSAAVQKKKSAVCVGLDPVFDRLPPSIREGLDLSDPLEAGAQAIETFCRRVCELVADDAATVKLQMAYFERFGPPGMRAARNVALAARELGLIVIGDIKRGDIGSTVGAFADAYFGETRVGDVSAEAFPWDAVTLSPYMGSDSIRPFLDACRDRGKGLYVLVRTSNPSSKEIQELPSDGSPVFHHVARLVDEWGREYRGASGFSSVGAVVGATFPRELAEARERMPHTPFLVPGVGAQGATAADVSAAFDSAGDGAVVNSSRGILYAYEKGEPGDWEDAVVQATRRLRDELQAALPVDA